MLGFECSSAALKLLSIINTVCEKQKMNTAWRAFFKRPILKDWASKMKNENFFFLEKSFLTNVFNYGGEIKMLEMETGADNWAPVSWFSDDAAAAIQKKMVNKTWEEIAR